MLHGAGSNPDIVSVTGVPAFFNATRMVAYRSEVSSSTISTLTCEDFRTFVTQAHCFRVYSPGESPREALRGQSD